MKRPWPTEEASATLNLTANAFAALSFAEMTELGQRCVDLHVRLSVMHDKHHRWGYVVGSWATEVSKERGKQPIHKVEHEKKVGHLADILNEGLDEYERLYVFTPDELAQIRRQTGEAA